MGKSKELATFTDAGGTLSGNLTFDSTNPSIVLGADNNQRSYIQRYSDDLYIYNKEAAGDVYLGSANTTRMTIDASGRVTMPYQPAFRAGLSASNTQDNSNPYTFTGVIAWDQVHVNRGSYYSNSNGRFTAPVAGCYCFHMSALLSTSITNSGGMRFVLNGSGLDAPIPYTYATGNFVFLSGSIVVNMNANDWVGVENYGGHALHINPSSSNEHNGFSGYLIG